MRWFVAAALAFAWLTASPFSPRALGAQSPPETRPATTPSPPVAPQVPTGWWQLRVPLDSGEVRVEVTSRAAAITVVAPTGTFLQAFATSRPLAEWADAAASLPVRAGEGPGVPAHVAELVDDDRNPTRFSLARAPGDSSAGYVLTGTNSAWPFALSLSPAQADALFGALRGNSASGALPYDYPRRGRTRGEDAPDVSGAWFTHQVDRAASPGPRPPRPRYPTALLGSGVAGTVRFQFIIDSTGHVVPSSVRLIGPAHPMLATAARDALLLARYNAAQRGGRSVPQIAVQDFQFETQ